MKQMNQLADGLLFLLVTLKLTAVAPSLTWIGVLVPLFLRTAVMVIVEADNAFNLFGRIKLRFFNWIVGIRLRIDKKRQEKRLKRLYQATTPKK